jgi:deoxyribodipyrimidine photolyase
MRMHDNPDLADATQVFVTLPSFTTEVETVKVGPGALRKKLFLETSFQDFSRQLEALNVSAFLVADENPTLGSDPTLNYDSLGTARELLSKNFTAFKKNLGSWSVTEIDEPVVNLVHEPHSRSSGEYHWQGGESAALSHWHNYVWEERGLESYKATRNGLLMCADSAKISPWLACGALSPKWVLNSVRNYEEKFGASESTAAFIDEILWRDYFKHLSTWAGENFFSVRGLRQRDWKRDHTVFRLWALGETGEPFIDAGMRELWWTGWMSNRLRQNTASYLTKSLGIDWTWGARWFAAHLIDEDPECNWGNWAYVSGAGTDPRDRVFNAQRQAEFYDPHGDYQSLWGKRSIPT